MPSDNEQSWHEIAAAAIRENERIQNELEPDRLEIERLLLEVKRLRAALQMIRDRPWWDNEYGDKNPAIIAREALEAIDD